MQSYHGDIKIDLRTSGSGLSVSRLTFRRSHGTWSCLEREIPAGIADLAAAIRAALRDGEQAQSAMRCQDGRPRSKSVSWVDRPDIVQWVTA